MWLVFLLQTTPLHLAAKEGHAEMVTLLLSKGADITLTDLSGRNCLDLAADHSRKWEPLLFSHNRNRITRVHLQSRVFFFPTHVELHAVQAPINLTYWRADKSYFTRKRHCLWSDTPCYAWCDVLFFLPHFDVIRDLLLNRSMAT